MHEFHRETAVRTVRSGRSRSGGVGPPDNPHTRKSTQMPHDIPPPVTEHVEPSVNLARRHLGGLLALFGGGAALSGCGPKAGGETLGRAIGAATGTTFNRADSVDGDLKGSTTTVGLVGATGDVVVAAGYYARGDGGGGVFAWIATTPPTTLATGLDDALIVVPYTTLGVRSTAGY